MAISFVGKETATNSFGTSHPVTRPAGAASGDVALLYLTPYSSDVSTGIVITPPSGWTPLADHEVGTNTTRSLLWRRVLGGSEPATYTVTTSLSKYVEIGCIVYRGVDNTTPEDAAVTENAGTVQVQTVLGVTTVTAGAQLVAFSSSWSHAAPTPAGMTLRAVWDGIAHIWDEARPSAGATGNRTSDMGATDFGWVTFMVALRPAGAGGGTFTGSGAPSLPALTGTGSGAFTAPVYTGSGGPSLAPLTGAGSGTFVAPVYTGAGAPSLPALTAEGTGTHTAPTYTGSGTPSLPGLTGEGVGAHTAPVYTGAGSPALPALTGTGAGLFATAAFIGAGAADLPALTGEGEGTFVAPTYTGAGAPSLPGLTGAGAGLFTPPVYTGAGAPTLPALTAAGVGAFSEASGDYTPGGQQGRSVPALRRGMEAPALLRAGAAPALIRHQEAEQ